MNSHPSTLAYEPLLGSRDIRLLVLEPGDSRSLVQCTLQHVSLEDGPQYEALSYTWGIQTDRGLVKCNGRLVSVTQNLEVALRRFQPSSGSRLLWVDALCINQDDLDERSRQVQIMRDIYANAHETLVWLGPAADGSDSAMDLYSTLRDLFDSETSGDYTDRRILVYNTFTSKSSNMDALRHLSSRHYFTRVWILQEISVSRHVTVFCGDRSMEWQTIELVSEAMEHIPTRKSVTPWRLVTLRAKFQTHRHVQLLELMSLAVRSHATDERDKIYALIGLTDQVLAEDTTADYSSAVSMVDIQKKVAWSILQSPLHIWYKFAVLSSAGIERGLRPGLPSWVPHFAPLRAQCIGGLGPTTGYCAAGTSVSAIRLGDKTDVLVVDGVDVDSICGLGDCLDGPDFPEDDWIIDSRALAKHEQRCLSFARQCVPYPTGESLHDVYWRTMVADLDENNQKASVEFGQNLGVWQRSMVEGNFAASEVSRFFAWDVALRRSVCGRRLCSTKRGYLGMFPECTQIGDLVCVFQGGPVPFLLRPQGDHQQLVGDCYVHGLMDGQAMEGENVQIREFMLK